MVTVDQWVLFIAFILIYATFLFYDVFKRGDNLGQWAYVLALLPANYAWYLLASPEMANWGPMGAMALLGIFWVCLEIRDIFLKDAKKNIKDADDVALFLLFGLGLQIVLSAVLPVAVPAMKLGTSPVLKYFYLPEFNPEAEYFATAAYMPYKIISTLVVLLVLIPIIMELKNEKLKIWVILVLLLIFAVPFYYLAFLWLPAAPWSIFFLFLVLLFILLLILTRGN